MENLDQKRDDKCFPVVRNVIKEFPSGLIKDIKGQEELQLKTLSLMLAEDFNVSQEVSYSSQLILGVLAGLNKTVQECGLINDEEKYERISRDVLKIVSDNIDTISLGVKPDEVGKDFENVKVKLLELFKSENLSQMEVKYVVDMIFDKYTSFNNALSTSITTATERMETKILGIESMSDLSLQKLNDVLIKN